MTIDRWQGPLTVEQARWVYQSARMSAICRETLDALGGTVGHGYRLLTAWELQCVPEGAECWLVDGWMPSGNVGDWARRDSLYRVVDSQGDG